jgi:hypothetical protein
MAKAKREGGDPDLHGLFEKFKGQLVSPGGAAALLGVSRKTIYTLGKRGRLRVFEGPHKRIARGLIDEGPRWVYIPIADVAQYAEEVGRPFPEGTWVSLDYLLCENLREEG